MYQKMLVLWDQPPTSGTALTVALQLGRRQDATIELVYVHQSPTWIGANHIYAIQPNTDRRETTLAELQVLAQHTSTQSGVRVESVFLEGEVLPTLIEYADRTRPDLIVMTSHDHGRLHPRKLGRITDGVTHTFSIAMLVVPTTPGIVTIAVPCNVDSTLGTPIFPRTLVPLDGSALAEAVFPSVSALAMPEETTILLLRIMPSRSDQELALTRADNDTSRDIARDVEVAAAAYLADVAMSLGVVGFAVSTHIVAHARPAVAILMCAMQNSIDLIALASHGRGGPECFLSGQVRNEVLRGATIPVLLHPHAPMTSLVDRGQ